MSYKQMFEQDSDYQAIVKDFNEKKQTIYNAAKSGVIDPAVLIESINKISSEFNGEVRKYHENKLKDLEQKQAEIRAKYEQDIDYTSNEAKQFEVEFSLAEDHELEEYARKLNSDNMLEINLLRMELRKRGLTDADNRVRAHAAGLEREYSKDAEYSAVTKQIATLHTMGTKAAILDGEYVPLDTLTSDLTKDVLETAKNAQRTADNAQILKAMQVHGRALESL